MSAIAEKGQALYCAITQLDEDLVAEAQSTPLLAVEGTTRTAVPVPLDASTGRHGRLTVWPFKRGNTPAPSGTPPGRGRRGRWVATAACLVLVGAILTAVLAARLSARRPVLQWAPGFAAQDYFAYNEGAVQDTGAQSVVDADIASTYDAVRWFSDCRADWEAADRLPVLADWPLFDCGAYYDADGALAHIVFHWHRQGPTQPYGDLSLTVGRQEVPQISDCIYVELDDDGNILPPAVTVTRRDGVSIVAEGREGRDKTLTFQNDNGWYRIEGSWNDGYNTLVQLLDWVWQHPLDWAAYPLAAGDEYTYPTHAEMPDAFAGRLPDFAAEGLWEEEGHLTVKNGVPVSYEGHWALGEGESAVSDAVHWCLTDQPDYYDLQRAEYTLTQLSEQAVADALTAQADAQGSIRFRWGDSCVTVYSRYPELVWRLAAQLQG